MVAHPMVLILGWFLYFRIIAFKVGWLKSLWWSTFTWCSGILRFLRMFEKISLKVLASSSSLEIVLPFLINTILSIDFIFSKKTNQKNKKTKNKLKTV